MRGFHDVSAGHAGDRRILAELSRSLPKSRRWHDRSRNHRRRAKNEIAFCQPEDFRKIRQRLARLGDDNIAMSALEMGEKLALLRIAGIVANDDFDVRRCPGTGLRRSSNRPAARSGSSQSKLKVASARRRSWARRRALSRPDSHGNENTIVCYRRFASPGQGSGAARGAAMQRSRPIRPARFLAAHGPLIRGAARPGQGRSCCWRNWRRQPAHLSGVGGPAARALWRGKSGSAGARFSEDRGPRTRHGHRPQCPAARQMT